MLFVSPAGWPNHSADLGPRAPCQLCQSLTRFRLHDRFPLFSSLLVSLPASSPHTAHSLVWARWALGSSPEGRVFFPSLRRETLCPSPHLFSQLSISLFPLCRLSRITPSLLVFYCVLQALVWPLLGRTSLRQCTGVRLLLEQSQQPLSSLFSSPKAPEMWSLGWQWFPEPPGLSKLNGNR